MKYDLLKDAVNEGVINKIKHFIKGPPPKKEPGPLEVLTDEDRDFVKKHFTTNHNADLRFNGKTGRYVLPTNITVHYKKGLINFHKRDNQLIAGVAYHSSEADRSNPKAVPLINFDEKISNDADMEKLKDMLV